MTLERKKRPKAVLQYAEDYLETLLEFLRAKEGARVEVIIEEEKAESLKIRIISTTPDGERVETVCEAPRLASKGLPLQAPGTVSSPPRLVRPVFPVEDEVSSKILLRSPAGARYPLQPPMRAFFSRDFRSLSPLSLPYTSPNIQAWFKETVKTVKFFEQPSTTAFTLKRLLRLIEIPLKLPRISEKVEARIKLPTLTSEKLFIQQEIKVALTETVETLRDVAQAQQLKEAGLLELLIPEEREKLRRFMGASGEYAGEPVIVILPESKYHSWYLFWIVCRELYREAKGAYPEPVVLLEKGHELWLRHLGGISGKIIVLHEQLVAKDDEREWFRRRLQEAFSQGLGFLVVIARDVDKAKASIVELCRPYMARIIDIGVISEPGYILILSRLAKTLSILFGIPYDEICNVEGLKEGDKITAIIEGKPQTFPKLDIMVARADRAYRDFLNELTSSNYLAFARRDVSEHESEDHIAMKILAIKNLHERFGLKLEKIASTCEVRDGVIADVYAEEKALAVECETMLGTAPAPLLKIFESVRKYVERPLIKPVDEVWVVIRNWPAVLHLGDVFWAENVLRKEFKQQGKKVKFFIPDVYTKRLKALDDVVREVCRELQP